MKLLNIAAFLVFMIPASTVHSASGTLAFDLEDGKKGYATLTDNACTAPKVVEIINKHFKPEALKEFREVAYYYGDRSIDACYFTDGIKVFIIDEDGDVLTNGLNELPNLFEFNGEPRKGG